ETYGGMRLLYSVEPSPLGTAGAVRWAASLFRTETLLLLNGDSYCEADLADFGEFHAVGRSEASLVLARVTDVARFGQVIVGEGGRVVRFEEKGAASGPGWVNAGIYLLDRRLIDGLPRGMPASLERDLMPRLVARGQVAGCRCGGRFIDIGTP